MRTSILAALGFAAALTMSATAGLAATVIGIGGGAGSATAGPPPQDINGGDTLVLTGSLGPGESSVDFTFTALDDLTVDEINISFNGLLTDVNLIDVTIDNGATGGVVTVLPIPGTPSAFGLTGFDAFAMTTGETVTVTFTDSSAFPGPSTMIGSLPIAFTALTTAVVPLPAGLPLLLTAAGGLAVVRARRKAA